MALLLADVPEPTEVLSAREIRRATKAADRLMARKKIATFIAVCLFILLFAGHVWAGSTLVWYNHGLEGSLFFVVLASPFIAWVAAYVWLEIRALNIFKSVDELYFNTTGLSKEQLREALIEDQRRGAIVSFSEPSWAVSHKTMWDFPAGEANVAAFHDFERRYMDTVRKSFAIPYDAYVLRLLGYR
jgi:hypothetical protein